MKPKTYSGSVEYRDDVDNNCFDATHLSDSYLWEYPDVPPPGTVSREVAGTGGTSFSVQRRGPSSEDFRRCIVIC